MARDTDTAQGIDSAVTGVIASFSGDEINTADASAISQLTYAIYSAVPHSADDKNLFVLDDIQINRKMDGKGFFVQIGQNEALSDSNLIPPRKKAFNFSKQDLIAELPSKIDIPENIQKQKHALGMLQEAMDKDPQFAETMQGHFQQIHQLQERGFHIKNYSFDLETNHGGLTLWHEPSKSVVFAHRGSEKSDWAGLTKDWIKTDGMEIVLLGKRLSKADEVAIQYVDHQFNEMAKKHPDMKNVFETGHSKGGRESQNAAAYLARKIGGYIAMRQVAYEQNLTNIKPPENINLTALTFNSARVRTTSRLTEWANKIGNANVVTRAFSKTLLYVSQKFESSLNKRMEALQAKDKIRDVFKDSEHGKLLQERIKSNQTVQPVKLNHLNISYADLNGKRADPVSNVKYGNGHLGRHIVVKHAMVNGMFAGHLMSRTHEIVQPTINGKYNDYYNAEFANSSVKMLVSAVQDIPEAELKDKQCLYTIAEINQECRDYKSKYQEQSQSKIIEAGVDGVSFAKMGSLERLKAMRQSKVSEIDISKPENIEGPRLG